MRKFLPFNLDRELSLLRTGWRVGVSWALRITVAAVAAYVVGRLLFPDTQPLLAPLTAMLVVQVTPVTLLTSGLDRVVAVVTGVVLAVLFASVVPLEWWSLGVLIFVSMALGQALRLRGNLLEVPISAMLVLGVGTLGTGSAAWQRIVETLVGAAVAVAANLVFPPKVASASAANAIDGLADSMSDLVNRAAGELSELVQQRDEITPSARLWLDEARRIIHEVVPRAGSALTHAEEGRRLNLRALRTPDLGPGLRQGLEALEHCAVAVRSMFRALLDATAEQDSTRDGVVGDLFLGLAQTLREVAAGIDAFGQLVRNDASPAAKLSRDDVLALQVALDGLQEARARLEDLLTFEATPELRELNAVALSTVRRLLREMHLEQRVRRQLELGGAARPRQPYLGRPRDRGAPQPTSTPSPSTRTALPTSPLEVLPDVETQQLPAQPRQSRKKPPA
ncbi:MAG: FUSC family protein [Nocardioidaceae bacterium]